MSNKIRKIKRKRWICRQIKKHTKYHKKIAKRKYIVQKRIALKRYFNYLIKQGIYPKKIDAPSDFRLMDNPKECCDFFSKMQDGSKIFLDTSGRQRIRIDFYNVQRIDFACVMALRAICYDLLHNAKPCRTSGRLPESKTCAKYLIDSGFLDNKYDFYGNKFTVTTKSQSMRVDKGCKRLTTQHIRNINNTLLLTMKHLKKIGTPNEYHSGMIKEICANTIRWSNAMRSQWMLGAKFEKNKVEFVALDLGCGILDSIHRNYAAIIDNLIKRRDWVEILKRAFKQKYGSTTKEINRNRGLPGIKLTNEKNYIKELKVITNNVVVNFNDSSKDIQISKSVSGGFHGTLYSWVIDSNCYENIE